MNVCYILVPLVSKQNILEDVQRQNSLVFCERLMFRRPFWVWPRRLKTKHKDVTAAILRVITKTGDYSYRNIPAAILGMASQTEVRQVLVSYACQYIAKSDFMLSYFFTQTLMQSTLKQSSMRCNGYTHMINI